MPSLITQRGFFAIVIANSVSVNICVKTDCIRNHSAIGRAAEPANRGVRCFIRQHARVVLRSGDATGMCGA